MTDTPKSTALDLPIRARGLEMGFSEDAMDEIELAADVELEHIDLDESDKGYAKALFAAERRRRETLVDRRVHCIAFLMRRREYLPGAHGTALAELWGCSPRTVYGYSSDSKRLSRMLGRDAARFKLIHAFDVGLGIAVEGVREARDLLHTSKPEARTWAINALTKALQALEGQGKQMAALTGAEEPAKIQQAIAHYTLRDWEEQTPLGEVIKAFEAEFEDVADYMERMERVHGRLVAIGGKR